MSVVPGASSAPQDARPRSRRDLVLQLAPLVLSLVLWVLSLVRIRVDAMTDYGLVTVLPVSYFAALVVLVVGFVVTVARPRPVRGAALAYVLALVLILHGTVPLLFDQPHYAWQYKHFGVVNYINLHGAVDEHVDIYQGWPGFFALCAWFSRLAGFDAGPVAFAAWSQVFFEVGNVLAFVFLVQSITANARVRWLATFLFVVGNWIGQDYLAPQAFGFLMSTMTFGVIFRWLRVAPGGPAAALLGRFPAGSATDEASVPPLDATPRQRRAATALALVLFTAIVVSHQLTPYMMLVGIAAMTVLDMIRPRWLVVAMAAIALGFLLHDYSFVAKHYGVLNTGDTASESTNVRTLAGKGLPGLEWVAVVARDLSLALWGLAAIGIVRRLLHGAREMALALLVVAPVLVMMAQSYGGEAIYRVFLFSLPWTVVLAAYALEPRSASRRRSGLLLPIVAIVGALSLFLPAYFGLEEDNVMRTGEVAAATHFYATAPSGSVLMVGIPNFPVRLGARYDQFKVPTGGDFTPNLIVDKRLRHRMLGPSDVPTVEDAIRSYGGTHSYLAFSKAQITHAELYGYMPNGSIQSLQAAIAQNPDWKLWSSNPDCVIYELVGPTPTD